MDRHTILVVLFIGTIAITSSGAGCSTVSGSTPGDEVDTVVADVDNIEVPEHISPSDTLVVRFSGRVGPNGCYSFDRFDVERTAGRLTITPVVRHRTGDDIMCTMAIVPLDETCRVAPPFSEGTWTVTVPQPEGENISSTVEVIRDGG